MRKVSYLTKYYLYSLILKLEYDLMQELRSDRPTLKYYAHIKANMTLNIVIGTEIEVM